MRHISTQNVRVRIIKTAHKHTHTSRRIHSDSAIDKVWGAQATSLSKSNWTCATPKGIGLCLQPLSGLESSSRALLKLSSSLQLATFFVIY